MKRIVIVGGGFAGLAAAKALGRKRRSGLEVILLDRRTAQQNLPLIPDLVGRAYDPGLFRFDLATAARRWGHTFLQHDVKGIDVRAGRLEAEGESMAYDHLIVATGSRTHLRHMAGAGDGLMVLDSAADAVAIRKRVWETDPRCIVVAGGSYTGVEVATQLQCALGRAGRKCRVVLLNRRERTCRNLPVSMSRYIEANLQRLGIEIRHQTTLDSVESNVACLSTGETLDGSLAIWTAGVQPPEVVRTLDLPVTSDGRLVTDASLQIAEHAHAAGDTAGFLVRGKPARMSVQFAIMSGRHAAQCVLRGMAGRPPRRFRPVDLGYVVPMANFRGCGTAMGVPIRGRLPMLLHYTMSLYRTFGWQNRMRLLAAFGRTWMGGGRQE
ncbi:NAD(P)/FAD-dependent oxidoreductase [Verrucomicrobiota bacterium]